MAKVCGRSAHPDIVFWRRCVKHWFPKMGERAYFVPPAFLCKTQHETVQFAGQDVRVTQPPLVDLPRGARPVLVQSQVREDEAHQRILHFLHKLVETQGEPVFVISQLQFGDYLGEACYTAAARLLPRPIDMKQEKKDRGDFDLLLLHKNYGIVVAEIKSIGEQFPLSLTEEQQTKVAERLSKGITQLNKAKDVLRHLVSDLPLPVRVRKTFMLPNITRDQLRSVLDKIPQVKQELCQCLDLEAPADLCLTADEVSGRYSPSDVNEEVLQRLAGWWIRAVSVPNVALPDDMYEELVARFAGPATTFRVFSVTQPPLFFRSLGEGVLETSRRFTKDIVLHPYQLEVLNRNEPLVWVCGPPGTGKTVMLVVRGRDWLCRGWNVHVVCTHREGQAASHLIVHQLQQIANHLQQKKEKAEQLDNGHETVQQQHHLQTTEDHPRSQHTEERVHLHICDLNQAGQVSAVVQSLQKAHEGCAGPLCVLADETCRDTFDDSRFSAFCTALCDCFKDRLHLWAANMYHRDRPPSMTEAAMTWPLRTPPVATEEIQPTPNISRFALVRDYTEGPSPAPVYGPPIRYLYHRGEGHCKASPVECEMCGTEVAHALSELHVAVAAEPTTSTFPRPTIPAPLTYRDVFLLTEWGTDSLDDDRRDDAGNIVRPASGVVRGLRIAGVPVKVVKPGDADLKDVAVMGGADQVVASWAPAVSGLERPVVVCVPTYKTATPGMVLTSSQEEENRRDLVREGVARLWVVSRTTAQLIWVVWPFDSLDTESEEEEDEH